jgi:hypothetical protein
MADKFWETVAEQLTELSTAQNADDVLRILGPDRNPYGPDWDGMDGQGFFAGSGGDGTVRESLERAGWELKWSRAGYWWAMQAPDGTVVTYIEGDIYRGNRSV